MRHLRIPGVTHRPMRGPQTTVTLALAYKAGPVPPVVRGYLELVRSVLRERRAISPVPILTEPELPESV